MPFLHTDTRYKRGTICDVDNATGLRISAETGTEEHEALLYIQTVAVGRGVATTAVLLPRSGADGGAAIPGGEVSSMKLLGDWPLLAGSFRGVCGPNKTFFFGGGRIEIISPADVMQIGYDMVTPLQTLHGTAIGLPIS